jgi:hypothetical protein
VNLDTAERSVADDAFEKPSTASRIPPAAATTMATATGAELARFVDQHYDRLLRLAWLVCREGGDAADAVQTGLEAAWRRLSGDHSKIEREACPDVGRAHHVGRLAAPREYVDMAGARGRFLE